LTSTAERYRKSARQQTEFYVYISFIAANLSNLRRYFSIDAKFYGGTAAISYIPVVTSEEAFARETLPTLALFYRQAISPCPPRHSAFLLFAQSAAPTFPRGCSLPSGATFLAHHTMPRGRGWTNREYEHLAQAFMESSENPILATDQTSQAFKVPAVGIQVNLRTFIARQLVRRFAARPEISDAH
jgi:hypothetical protein